MAEHPKVHPVGDAEAPPTRPLVPKDSFPSDKGDPMRHQPPPFRQHAIASLHSKPPSSRSCFCRCFCWTITLLLLVLIIIGATVGILYLVFQPKIPNYSVDNLSISYLRLNFDMTLYAKFNVRITAVNPNKKIGIYYKKGSHLSVWYKSTKLCQGTLPTFYQGHQNKTVLPVSLAGQSQYGNTLLGALQEQQQTGRIPLDLRIDVPVSIKLGRLKLRKVRVLGNCLLVVDSLSTNSLISIKTSDCKFKLKL